ncbi:PspC domain-containing protein [Lactiplantibacillus plajomi]|uniref:PspC domain-containing protein n=1 Tax=Lactiplantibacillus plajomi TaxID=1457217 RepID=A0ABV6K0Y9_9LACO|nr:PspC domain-containing protein [Lactiplantibacillus plajomi]
MELRRSKKGRLIAGVCGGIAEYFDVSVVAVRLVFFFGSGVFFWIYLFLMAKIPENDFLE